MFLLVFVISVGGYKLILDISLIDAIYMTAITVSTVGYGEVAEMTTLSKLFTIGIIRAGPCYSSGTWWIAGAGS